MAENDTKKWVFIGCGGCLGILVVVGILLFVGGSQLFGQLQEGSQKTVQAIFGESYKVPPEYTALGMTVGEGEQEQNVATLLDIKNQKALFAMKMPVSEANARALTSSDPEKLKGYMETLAAEMQDSASEGSSRNVEEIAVDEVHVMQIANGKMVPVAYLRAKEGNEESPGVIMAVVQPDNRQVVLMGMSQVSGAADAEGFKKSQQTLEDDLLNLMQDSEIDERIP